MDYRQSAQSQPDHLNFSDMYITRKQNVKWCTNIEISIKHRYVSKYILSQVSAFTSSNIDGRETSTVLYATKLKRR